MLTGACKNSIASLKPIMQISYLPRTGFHSSSRKSPQSRSLFILISFQKYVFFSGSNGVLVKVLMTHLQAFLIKLQNGFGMRVVENSIGYLLLKEVIAVIHLK